MRKPIKDSDLYCYFCSKNKDEVGMLHAGFNAFICNECVELCMDIQNRETKHNDLGKVIKDLRTALDENVNK